MNGYAVNIKWEKMNKYAFKVLLLLGIMFTPLSAVAAKQVYFYHTDPAGTPLAMSDSNGSVVWRADYKPFGEENTVASNVDNNKEFVGKEKDDESGLYYFGARYMNPKTGRFTAVDPVGAVDERTSRTNEKLLLNPQSLNPYAYSLNNPYRFVDPDGNTVWDVMDFAFFGNSAYRFARDPSWSNAGDLAMDTVGLLPMVPSIGSVKMVGKGISKIDEAAKEGTELGKETLNGIHSLEQRIAEHQEKLDKFKANPTVRPGMENLPREVIEKQQQSRIRHLEKEIQTFKQNIDKLRKGE